MRIVNPFSLPFWTAFAVYITQLENYIEGQNDKIMEQQLQLQQQQQLINNLEQVEVFQNRRIQNLEKHNSRMKGKLHECELSINILNQLFV